MKSKLLKDAQVTFKLEATFFELLEEAASAKGLSPNLYARELVVDALTKTGGQFQEIKDAIARLASELSQLAAATAAERASAPATSAAPPETIVDLRIDLAVLAAALLQELRPNEVPEKIAEWVKANLLRRR